LPDYCRCEINYRSETEVYEHVQCKKYTLIIYILYKIYIYIYYKIYFTLKLQENVSQKSEEVVFQILG